MEHAGQGDNKEPVESNILLTTQINSELIRLIKRVQNFEEDLSPEEQQQIKSTFSTLKEGSQEEYMFEILKNCGDVATIEKVMNFIKTEFYSQENIYSSIMESVKDLDRRSWAIKHFKQGLGYKFNKMLELKCSWVIQTKRKGLPILFCVKAIASIHIDFIKDIVIFLALKRYNDLILVCSTSQLFSFPLIRYIFSSKDKVMFKLLEGSTFPLSVGTLFA